MIKALFEKFRLLIPGGKDTDLSLELIFFFGMLILVLIVVLLIGGTFYYHSNLEYPLYESIQKPIPENLRVLLQREDEALNSYLTLDSEKGIYQIPIERAMELLVEENKR